VTHTHTHEYWYVAGIVDMAKVHDEAYRKSTKSPGVPYVVHTHSKGKCPVDNKCVTYIDGRTYDGKVRTP
jgi:hypothetical protein